MNRANWNWSAAHPLHSNEDIKLQLSSNKEQDLINNVVS